MRPILESIRTASSMVQNILGTLRNFFEQVVWPVAEINRIRALVQQLIAPVLWCAQQFVLASV